MSQNPISPRDVMALRAKTGLGMMDCKEALIENSGDMAAAEEWLRKKLKGKMDSRTERATAEGRVEIVVDGSKAAIVEVQTESDFTARNDAFVAMVGDLAKMALAQPAGSVQADDQMKKRLDDVRLTTGENMSFARGVNMQGGSFGFYVHHDNKRAALVNIEGAADEETLRGICQHIVAHVPPPVAVGADDMPQDELAKVRAEAEQEAGASGKPADIVKKIAEGKVRKYLEENTLLDQKFVRDDTKKVREILPAGVTVKRFVRYTVGA